MNVYSEQAIKLIDKQYTVIPLRGKVPQVKGWQELRGVTPEQVTEWEGKHLWQNIGMVCGAASGNLVVVDFDGLEGYDAFCNQFPELANTYTVKTGSGNGMHCYFKVDLLPDSIGVLNIPLQDGVLVNIEVKSDGKQVVIPPSIHPDTGKAYEVYKRVSVKKLTDLSAVINWIQSFRTMDEWTPPAVRLPERSGNLNPALLSAVERHFTSQPHKVHGAWINTTCPNAAQHKHGDKVQSFGYNTDSACGHCFRCGVMNLKALLPMLGMDAKDFGGMYEKVEPSRNGSVPQGFRYEIAVDPIQPLTVVTRESRLTDYANRILDFDTPREAPPVVFPFKVLHKFGGMARVGRRGRLIGIVGVSGGGKTSLLESMVDGYLKMNTPVLIWSPEWTPDEFVERAVQRYGGARMEDMYLHEVHIWETQNGIKSGVGVPMTKDKQDASIQAIRALRQWETQVGYINEPFMNLEQFQARIQHTLWSLTFKPGVIVFDYVQLLDALGDTPDMTMYKLLMRLKAVCNANNMQGILASQVTKDNARGQANGKMLDSLAAQYVRDDAFNLFVTINPDRNKETGDFLPSAVLNVAKNSFGKRGRVRVPTCWERLSFEDREHPDQSFGEDD